MNRKILHVEGLAIFILSLFFYWYLDLSWLWFIILILAPDISMLGYLHNNKTGTKLYNLCHTYTIPIVLLLLGYYFVLVIFVQIAIIWTAHIAVDRLFGFGLKYPSQFKDGHLNRV